MLRADSPFVEHLLKEPTTRHDPELTKSSPHSQVLFIEKQF
jgi:hypothetical protein